MTEKSEHQGLTVSDIIVRRLKDWGVARVYGYSGDGINGLLDALRRANGTPTFIQARHEENAALMAVGEAKYGGTVGVIVSTQGPGAVHLLNGLYDAKLDGGPRGCPRRAAAQERARLRLHAGSRHRNPHGGRRRVRRSGLIR